MKRIEDRYERVVNGVNTSLNKAWAAIREFIRRESLLRTVVITLVLISLLPVVFFGSVSYYRTRLQIQSMVAGQLKNIADSGAKQIQEYASTRAAALETISKDTQLVTLVNLMVHPEKSTPSEANTAVFMIQNYLQTQSAATTSGETVFDQVFLLDGSGKQVAATDSNWMYNTFGSLGPGTNPIIRPLLQKGTSSSLLYDAFTPYTNRFALATVKKFKIPNSKDEFALVGISSTRLPIIVLNQAAGFFSNANSYFYFQPKKTLIGAKTETVMQLLPSEPSVINGILPVIRNPQAKQPLSFNSFKNEQVLAYVKSIPELGLYLVLEVPTSSVFSNIPFLDTFNIYMLILAIVILSVLAYFATTQVVNPLLQLTGIAQGLAGGNFQLRANVKRNDEIGQLAGSMNKMAADLASLYATLEEKVEQRTSQLRAASEVAQLATSSRRMEDILKKTVELVSERFGYYHTAIYLVDETGAGINLKEASGELGEARLRHAHRILVNDENIPCWVVRSQKARIIPNIAVEESLLAEDILPDTRSEAAFPISIGNEVLGALVVHSSEINAFDTDAVFVLQTLANQVASALQNTRLLETAQVDLEETALLYRVTRQITQSPDEKTIVNLLLEALPQLPHTNALLTLDGSNLHILGMYDARLRKYERNLNTIDIPVMRFVDSLLPGQPVYIQDITHPTNYDNVLSFFLRRGCKSALLLPCLQSNKLSKLIILGFREEERISQTILQPFTNLAEVISTTLDKYMVLETLQQRLSELQILANISKASSAETDLKSLYRTLHQQVMETMGSDLGFMIATFEEKKDQFELPYAFENGELISIGPFPLGQGLTSYVLQNRTPLLINKDAERRSLELGAHIVGKPAKSWMGVPLVVGGELIGALILQDLLHEERFTDSDLNLFMTLAPQIATSVRNAQLLEQMDQAIHAYDDERLLINTWLNNTPDIVIIKDAQGNYLRTSQSVYAFFNTQPGEVTGKSDFNFMDPEIASQSTEEEIQILQSHEAHFNVLEKNNRGGNDIWFVASKIPVIDPSGEPSGLLTIRRDITELKSAEEQSRRRADQLLTASEIARDATSTLEINDLLNKAVNLVRDRFGYYHASIFLLDELGKFAVLRESTGEAGRQMIEAQHKLAVGSKSIVGQATSRAEAVIVDDVTSDPTHLPNPMLPNTRAELAIPLKIGERVLGALDVQSEEKNNFNQEDISILGILADQLAVALTNAELFTSTQALLGKHRLLHQITVAASSGDSLEESLDRVVNGLVIAQVADRATILLANNGVLEVMAINGYDITQLPTTRIAIGDGLIGAAASERRPILVQDTSNEPRYMKVTDSTSSELTLPILFGDELLGVLNMESDQLAGFDENDQEIMIALANNIGAVIVNWRLVNQIRKQVERQQSLFSATAKIRRSIDIESILQTSVNEIGRAMGVQKAKIVLTLDEPKKVPPGIEIRTDFQPEPGKNGKHASNRNGSGKEA